MAIPNSQNRRRAMSTASSSDGSPSSPLQTPVTPLSAFPPKIATSPSATSPIFSYFMSSTSPTAKSNTLPFRRPLDAIAGNPPVFEGECLIVRWYCLGGGSDHLSLHRGGSGRTCTSARSSQACNYCRMDRRQCPRSTGVACKLRATYSRARTARRYYASPLSKHWFR